MGNADALSTAWLKRTNILADLINGQALEGKQIVRSENLIELDTALVTVPFGPSRSSSSDIGVSKPRACSRRKAVPLYS